ncbi:M15 family metallopeptidase [Abyssalbus ytuae]|uniref:D-alanyl-D-alanine dipeptidase n=1 Tax=Abyssalbus ytuae TaxID=2926907 RepID=A0A9E6ZXT9_9FLAO|nr:M15 family metallopeptidase [Abyssalbus ytuae]UOB17152.1 M15 family metallopeptidase [Abyssalbus ytuae]
MKYILLTFIFLVFLFSCKKETPKKEIKKVANTEITHSETPVPNDSVIEKKDIKKQASLEELNDTVFIKLKDYSDDFVYDLKYATNDNFLKTVVYDCPECYLRVSAARAIIKANKEFMSKGYKIKFFDCYRPHDVQKKMWKIMPNRIYVADPAVGSIHNKGGAVDMTLVTLKGDEVDMGTHFDYFGREAHHAYRGFNDSILKNRLLLKETMEKHGFGSITSEWWHYNHKGTLGTSIANFRWDCE